MPALPDRLRSLRIVQRPEAIERGLQRMLQKVREKFGTEMDTKVATSEVAKEE